MRLALFALALTLPAASSAEAPATKSAAKASVPARICSQNLRPKEARPSRPTQLKRLGELPAGNLTLTVVNRVGDCIEPIVVRQGFGAARR